MKPFFPFIIVASWIALANAQSAPPQPEFEVASVKPRVLPRGAVLFVRNPLVPSRITISGSRVTTDGTLFELAAMAYGLQVYQVAISPDWSERWASRDIYDIEARTPGETAATYDRVRPMLQALLANRFQIRIHRESRQMPVYDLVVGPAGSKMNPNTSADPPKMHVEGLTGSHFRLRFVNFSMAEFIATLVRYFDRPLLDKTGLAGGFDFAFEFDAQLPGTTAAVAAPIGAPDPEPGLPIVASIQHQLGLRVVSAKGPVEILVIDHAERASAN